MLEMAERLNIINTIKKLLDGRTEHYIAATRGDNFKEPKKSFLSYIKRFYETFIKRMLISYCLLFLISRQSCDDVREQFGVEAQ